MTLPGMETGNFLELYFFKYFVEPCTRLCHRTLYVQGGLFLEPEHAGDLDGATWEGGVSQR